MGSRLILVLGATGTVGSQVLRHLEARGEPVRALAHDAAKAAALESPNVRVATGDILRPATLTNALQGVSRLFLLAPPSTQTADLKARVLDAAQDAGVHTVCSLSAFGADPDSPVQLLAEHGRADEIVQTSGMRWTLLRSHLFMQNLLPAVPSIAERGFFSLPLKHGNVGCVDAGDVGAVAADVLTEKGHEGNTYELTGPESIPMEEAARRIGAHLGAKVAYKAARAQDARRAYEARGVPRDLATQFVELMEWFGDGNGDAVTRDVERILGRPPRDFDHFVRDHLAEFKGEAQRRTVAH